MFGNRYFTLRYFQDRYFPPGTSSDVPVTPDIEEEASYAPGGWWPPRQKRYATTQSIEREIIQDRP